MSVTLVISMPETLAQCITQLEGLLQGNIQIETCAEWPLLFRALKAITGKWSSYADNIIVAECFLGFFCENVGRLLQCLEAMREKPEEREEILAEFAEVVFAITEETAVLMREYALRTGYSGLNQDELDFMDYFDASGRWFLGDGTMVSEYYYVRVPVRVIAEYVKIAGKATSA